MKNLAVIEGMYSELPLAVEFGGRRASAAIQNCILFDLKCLFSRSELGVRL